VRLVKLEMQWTINWFRSQEARWMERLDDIQNAEREEGLICYCHKQMGLWRGLGNDAEQRFSEIIGRDQLA
jgi:hypothetical protein